MNATVGKSNINPYPFVIVTADTRSVYRRLYTETMEYDEKILDKRDDSYDKVIRISNNVLISTGGTHEASEPMKDFIIERTGNHYYLDDFKQILEEGYKHLKENGDEVIKWLLDGNSIYVCLIGFFKNGSPGSVKLGTNGKIDTQEISPNYNGYNIFSPTEDIEKRQDELMNFADSPFLYLLNKEGSVADVYFNHLLYVHELIASQEVDTVSATCLVHLLQNVDGKMHYVHHEIDLTEQIKEIQNG